MGETLVAARKPRGKRRSRRPGRPGQRDHQRLDRRAKHQLVTLQSGGTSREKNSVKRRPSSPGAEVELRPAKRPDDESANRQPAAGPEAASFSPGCCSVVIVDLLPLSWSSVSRRGRRAPRARGEALGRAVVDEPAVGQPMKRLAKRRASSGWCRLTSKVTPRRATQSTSSSRASSASSGSSAETGSSARMIVGLLHQRPGDRGALLLAARERLDSPVPETAELDLCQNRLRLLPLLGRVPAEEASRRRTRPRQPCSTLPTTVKPRHEEVLLVDHRHRRWRSRVDPLELGSARDPHRPGRGPQATLDQPGEGGLARTAVPEHEHPLTRPDLERSMSSARSVRRERGPSRARTTGQGFGPSRA